MFKGNIHKSIYVTWRLTLEADDFHIEDDEGYFHFADDYGDEVNE